MSEATASDTQLSSSRLVQLLRPLAIDALRRMYLPDRRMFAFRLLRSRGANLPEGTSRRYTAIALLGLAQLPTIAVRRVLAGDDPNEICGRLLRDLDKTRNLGEVALTAWASRTWEHSDATRAIRHLANMDVGKAEYPTVEIAWSLAALCIQAQAPTDLRLAGTIAERLISAFRPNSGLFAHWPANVCRRHLFRSHVGCFADMVYPILALSRYYRVSGVVKALDAARRCADRICKLQGPHGQWWWHYDVRYGRVLERYPVYSVHQDSMAPMALNALDEVSGEDRSDAIRRGLLWLAHSPEINSSLIDLPARVIWRKVARHEPFKLTRRLQAITSRIHPSLRAPLVRRLFAPRKVDFETRPYHMGWILYAWPSKLSGKASPVSNRSVTSCRIANDLTQKA